jgi:hypothetical protein
MTKYEYLFDADNKLVHNSEAIRLNEYRLYPNEPLDYIYKQGDEREYFAKKIETNNVFGFVGVKEQGIYGESPEHYNAKMKIVHESKYFDTIFNQWIEFDLVVPEFYHDIKKRPDLSCYDAKNKLVCCIEICWSNAKTEIDIIKLKELKVPIIEIHLKNDNKSKHLVLTEVLESNKSVFEELQKQFRQANEKFGNLTREHESIKTSVGKINARNEYLRTFNEKGNGDFKDEEIDTIEREIKSCIFKTIEIIRNLRAYSNRTQDEETQLRLHRELNNCENEIKSIEGLIEINAWYSDEKTDNFLWIN